MAESKRYLARLRDELATVMEERANLAMAADGGNEKARRKFRRIDVKFVAGTAKIEHAEKGVEAAQGRLAEYQAELETIAHQEKIEDYEELSAQRLSQVGVAERAIEALVQALDQMAGITDRMRPAFKELCPPDPQNRPRSEFEGQLGSYETKNRLEWYASARGIQRYFGAQSSLVALPHGSFTEAERAAQAYLVDLIDPPPPDAAADGTAGGEPAPAESAPPRVLRTFGAGIKGAATLLTGGAAQGPGG